MQNKYFKFLIIALAVAVIVPQIALAAWWNPMSWNWNNIWNYFFQKPATTQTQKIQTPIVGGGKDSHGCSTDGGYSWCDAKQKCLRPWEEACDILSDAYPLFSNLKWSNEAPKTNQNLAGYEITASGQIQNNTDARDFFNYYDTKLKAAGWAADNNFAADGVTGSQVGYQKGNDYIVLSYTITPGKITSNANEPLQYTCPCGATYSIFTTTLSQAADSIDGWKTYTNNKYGFQINYPSNWIADFDWLSHTNSGEGSVVFCPPELQDNNLKNGITDKVGGCIVGKTNGGSINPEAPIGLRQCDLRATNGLERCNPSNLFTDKNNNYGYNLYIWNAKYQNIFNQMLSTFKFTK